MVFFCGPGQRKKSSNHKYTYTYTIYKYKQVTGPPEARYILFVNAADLW